MEKLKKISEEQYYSKLKDLTGAEVGTSWFHGDKGIEFYPRVEIKQPISFPGDDEIGKEAIKRVVGNLYKYEGRSGLAHRNNHTREYIPPSGGLKKIQTTNTIRVRVRENLPDYLSKDNKYVVEGWEIFKGVEEGYYIVSADDLQFFTNYDEEYVKEINKKIKEEYKKIKKERAEKLVEQIGLNAVVECGGDTGIEFSQLQEAGYVFLVKERIARTQDHRQNRTHTYRAWVVHKKITEGKEVLKLQVPVEFENKKGLIIGKGGQRIKEVAKELGVSKIILL